MHQREPGDNTGRFNAKSTTGRERLAGVRDKKSRNTRKD